MGGRQAGLIVKGKRRRIKMAKEKPTCMVCGKPAGAMKMKYYDGITCFKCFKKAYAQVFRTYNSVGEIRTVLEQDFTGMTIEDKINFGKKLDEKAQANNPKMVTTKLEQIRIRQEQAANTAPKCPRCGSESITANQQGFGIGKAVVGAAMLGPIGLMAGNINSKKVYITCLNCGHRWEAGRPG
jgi:Zn finger protein HypA/HybF involved in hydrogenase expression